MPDCSTYLVRCHTIAGKGPVPSGLKKKSCRFTCPLGKPTTSAARDWENSKNKERDNPLEMVGITETFYFSAKSRKKFLYWT
jgi:hypothetical protein